MVLLGLSLLVASVSFLCYRHLLFSWSFLDFLRRPAIQDVARKQGDAPTSIPTDKRPTTPKAEAVPIPIVLKDVTKDEFDRKAMPPPPLPQAFKKPNPKLPSPSTTPPASASATTPTIPSFNLSRDINHSPPAPSFPAPNSAQRASGGTRGPPRLNPLPATTLTAGLMAPPTRSPLPNRIPSNASSSLAPPPTHNSIPSKPRKKVLLTPGHSPLDWARLSSSPTANLRGLPPSTPYIRVPPSLLKKMTGRKGKDAWTVLGGKVYNLTPYLPYHPGGEPELMKAAGRDGTRLFGEVHPWVNWEGMLEPCLIGVAVEESEVKAEGSLEEMD